MRPTRYRFYHSVILDAGYEGEKPHQRIYWLKVDTPLTGRECTTTAPSRIRQSTLWKAQAGRLTTKQSRHLTSHLAIWDFHYLILRVHGTDCTSCGNNSPISLYLFCIITYSWAKRATSFFRVTICFTCLDGILVRGFPNSGKLFFLMVSWIDLVGRLLHFAYNSGIAASQSLQDWV